MFENKNTPLQGAGVMYQIYPRSFQDIDDDGVGDLRGITKRLDYLKDLGVNSIWLSPIYPSPMKDFGYDISDYTSIDSLFGSLEDFDELVKQAHARDIKIVMDYVINHTSEEHKWFIESKSSRENPKRNWYIWRDPKPNGEPPNNWISMFGGSAWKLDETTNQFYLHTFLTEQPDLNWRNPEVKQAMIDILRFWIDRGVDGFRTDAFAHVFKDPEFRDEPLNPDWRPGRWDYTKFIHSLTQHHPDLYLLYEYFDQVFNDYPDRQLFMISEDYAGLDNLRWHHDHSNPDRFAPINIRFSQLHWDAQTIRQFVEEYETRLKPHEWPNHALSNHDVVRISDRAGSHQIRVAAMLQMTLRGMPIIYYGDEIGMHDTDIPQAQIHDPVSKQTNRPGRDPERTPMQWANQPGAGFTNGEPWLPIAKDYNVFNVDIEQHDPSSVLSLYKRLIQLRAEIPALVYGSYESNNLSTIDVYCYHRRLDDQELLIALNMSYKDQTIKLDVHNYDCVLNTDNSLNCSVRNGYLFLKPHEGVILRKVSSEQN
ncbi:DUF3459 domain-containing protein [Candidatus Nomurabacteria bacterium]|nr:DUF3459 domain-containing protein [Candidatus Nomurabacteria bacterium]